MSCKIKGCDTGFLYYKNDEKLRFRSAYNKDGISMGATAFINIDGVDYSVGAGNRNIQYDKSDSEMNKVTILTDLCMDGGDEFCLVAGSPISQFKAQKDKFKKMIMGYNDCKVIYRGEEKKIKINDVLILPQGIGALLSLNNLPDGEVIIFDFGGMTIDIAYIEVSNGNPVLIKYDTITSGIQKLYTKLVARVSQEDNEPHDPSYGEKILIELHKGVKINGEYKSADFLLSTLKEYLNPIFTEFNVNYPAKNTKIYTCGGSSIIFEKLFKAAYPLSEPMPNSQFANAIGYQKAGMNAFSKYIPQETKINVCGYRR